MLVIHHEGDNKKNRRLSAVYKGRIIKNFIVLEDIVDNAQKSYNRHHIICKCLSCGRIRTIGTRYIKYLKCTCEGKHNTYKFMHLKPKMLKFLVGEKNRLRLECLYPEDEERLKGYDMVINFINSRSLKNYFYKGLDKTWGGVI